MSAPMTHPNPEKPMTNIDAAVERLNGCAEHLECNALNLEADTLDGDPNADFYQQEAAKQLQWSKDLRTILSALATTQAELVKVKGETNIPVFDLARVLYEARIKDAWGRQAEARLAANPFPRHVADENGITAESDLAMAQARAVIHFIENGGLH